MTLEQSWSRSSLDARARRHRALGDPHRLAIIDALALSDRPPSELCDVVELSSNLLAFHLDILEEAGLIARHASEGDRRRRYVTLRDDAADMLVSPSSPSPDPGDAGPLLFVCRRNSARSQLAAALWTARTGRAALSAGLDPALSVHRHAVAVARRHGLDLSRARPRAYDEVAEAPGLVVSVCDRAREAELTFDAPLLHWSVRDPAGSGVRAFERAYARLHRRIDRLGAAVAA